MIFDSYGKLAVSTFVADGALPLEGAIVTVRGASEENREVLYSLVTDKDGMTREISLPTPAAIYSERAGATSMAYGAYDIDVSAENYYTKSIRGVAVFDGIRTILPVNMIPSPINNENQTYPRGNLNTVITENERL